MLIATYWLLTLRFFNSSLHKLTFCAITLRLFRFIIQNFKFILKKFPVHSSGSGFP